MGGHSCPWAHTEELLCGTTGQRGVCSTTCVGHAGRRATRLLCPKPSSFRTKRRTPVFLKSALTPGTELQDFSLHRIQELPMVRTCVSPLNPDCSERRRGPVNLGLRGERDFALRFRFQLFEKIRIVEF